MGLGLDYEMFCLSPPGSSVHDDIQSQSDTQDNASGELESANKAKGIATFATVH